ncbi:MAG: hypothetical protein ACRCUQ_05625 [Alphaproteobacteria bacterium]
MKPSPLKKKESPVEEASQPTKLLTWVKDWRWGLCVLVLFLFILGLTAFWESRVEPKLGMHVTGETTDRSDAIPPILEKISPLPSAPEEETTSQDAPFPNPVEKQTPSAEPLVSFETHLQGMKEAQRKIFEILEKRQQVWAAFLLLRQDARAGMPFEATWALFEQLAEKELQHLPIWREASDTLRTLSSKGMWSRGKLLQRLPRLTLKAPPKPSAQTNWLEKIKGFFQNLFVVKHTNTPIKTQNQSLKQLSQLLEAGDVNAALTLLGKLSLSPSPDLDAWLEKAKTHERGEAALLNLQKTLLSLPTILEKAG